MVASRVGCEERIYHCPPSGTNFDGPLWHLKVYPNGPKGRQYAGGYGFLGANIARVSDCPGIHRAWNSFCPGTHLGEDE